MKPQAARHGVRNRCKVRTICEYFKAVAEVLRYEENKEIEEHTYNTIFDLVRDLSEEALRRKEFNLSGDGSKLEAPSRSGHQLAEGEEGTGDSKGRPQSVGCISIQTASLKEGA